MAFIRDFMQIYLHIMGQFPFLVSSNPILNYNDEKSYYGEEKSEAEEGWPKVVYTILLKFQSC